MFACIAPAPVAMLIAAHYIGEFAPSLALPAKALAELAGIVGILVFLAALTRFAITRLWTAEASG